MALVARNLGRRLIPWQVEWVALIGERNPADPRRYAYPVAVGEVPRQVGKSTTVLDVAYARCLARPGYRAAYTAQSGVAAQLQFRERVEQIQGSPLAPLCRARMSQGSERVTFRNGSVLRLFPPTPDALRGDHLDLVIVDEAQAHDELRGRELDQAIVPTFTTRPARQLIVIGTAGTAESAYFRRYVDLGAAGGSAVAFTSYGAPPAADPTDPAVWAAHHPGLGHVTDTDALATALAAMGPESFAREFLNVWPDVDDALIHGESWRACADPDATIPDGAPIAVGFDVNYDRTAASVAVAARVGAYTVVEVVSAALPVAALVPRLVELGRRYRCPIVGAPSQSQVADALVTGHRLDARVLPGRAYTAACQSFTDAVQSGALRHRGQPDLDAAIAAAGRSRSGDAWAWSHRNSSAPIDPLVAATLAVSAALVARPRAVWAIQ